MNRIPLLCAAAFALLATAPTPASAQAPKKFEWFEETVDLGFKIKRPEGWNLIPPSPGERMMLAKFAHPFQYAISIGPDDELNLYGWLIKFDRRVGPDGEARRPPKKDILSWVKGESDTGASTWTIVEQNELRGVDVPATEYLFEGPFRFGKTHPTIRCYAAVFTITEDLEVALVFNGPGDRSWRKYGKAFEKTAKSFDLVALEKVEHAGPAEGVGAGGIRNQKRHELENYCAATPGWEMYETPNYFVISNNDDDDFLDELQERLEAIRKVYEKQYPPEKARRVKNKPTTPGGDEESAADGDGEDEGAKPEEDMRSISVQADPLEASRTSVVRVCGDRDQYVDYGGPGGSAGYWYSVDEELVVYDDKAVRGRDFTWLVLNHEAFHQYIYYFYGNISPHSWYNEGTGDYFSGFEYKRKRFIEGKSKIRERDIQQMIREERYAPLNDFVRWTQGEYYGSNDLGISGTDCYAQGWSLIWFLRTGDRENANGWDRRWNDILDVYLATLAETGDLDKAVDTAFAGVDWEAFEASWKSYIE